MVDGRPQARLQSCEGRSPSLVLVQICGIWFAWYVTSKSGGMTEETQSSLTDDVRTGRHDAGELQLMCRMRRWFAHIFVSLPTTDQDNIHSSSTEYRPLFITASKRCLGVPADLKMTAVAVCGRPADV